MIIFSVEFEEEYAAIEDEAGKKAFVEETGRRVGRFPHPAPRVVPCLCCGLAGGRFPVLSRLFGGGGGGLGGGLLAAEAAWVAVC